MSVRRTLWTAAKLALALGVLAAVASAVDFTKFVQAVRGAAWPLLGVALIAFVADNLLVTHRWSRLLGGVGIEVPYIRLIRVYLEGRFLAFFLPSAVAADLYKGAALASERGSGAIVASSIVLERILGLASIATLSLAAAASLPARILGAGRGIWLVASGLAVLAGAAVFLHADRIAARLLPRLPRRWARFRGLLEDLTRAFAAYRTRASLLAETFALSLTLQALRGLAVWLVARAVADRTPFGYFIVLVPYVYMVSMLPFASSRIGLEQGVFVALFAAAGMAPERALAVSLLSVAGSFVAALPGGLGLLARASRGER